MFHHIVSLTLCLSAFAPDPLTWRPLDQVPTHEILAAMSAGSRPGAASRELFARGDEARCTIVMGSPYDYRESSKPISVDRAVEASFIATARVRTAEPGLYGRMVGTLVELELLDVIRAPWINVSPKGRRLSIPDRLPDLDSYQNENGGRRVDTGTSASGVDPLNRIRAFTRAVALQQGNDTWCNVTTSVPRQGDLVFVALHQPPDANGIYDLGGQLLIRGDNGRVRLSAAPVSNSTQRNTQQSFEQFLAAVNEALQR